MNLKNYYLDFVSLPINVKLLVLLPALLITGPFLPDFAVTLNSIIFIYFIFKNKINIFKYTYVKIFFIFYFYIVFISFLSYDIFFSLKTTLPYLRFIFFSLSLIFFFQKYEKAFYLFYCILLISILAASIDGIIQFIFGYDLLGLKRTSELKISGFFGKEMILGSYLSRLYPILVGLFIFFQKKKKFNQNYLIFISIFVTIAVLITGERTSLFFYFMSLIIFFLVLREYKVIFLKNILIFLLILFSFLFFNMNIKKRLISETLSQIFINEPDYKNNDLPVKNRKIFIFSEGHETHIKTAYKIFESNILIGRGPKIFRILCKEKEFFINKDSCTTHPHNIYVQLLAEAGIIGFLIVFLIFIYISYNLVKNFFLKKTLDSHIICFLTAAFINFFPFVPTGNFFSNTLSVYYYLTFSLIYFTKKNIK